MLKSGEKGLGASMWAGKEPPFPNDRNFYSTTIRPTPGYGNSAGAGADHHNYYNGNSNNSSNNNGGGPGGRRPSSAGGPPLSPEQELQKVEKILMRLQWKMMQLSAGLERAEAAAQSPQSEESRARAEFMFKLDFYEFYMLLERVLVHLMLVFGVSVSSLAPSPGSNRPGGYEPMARDGGGGGGQGHHQHRYHHDVIAALENPASPLGGIFGHGDVASHAALVKAKTLRNQWKNCDVVKRGGQGGGGGGGGALPGGGLAKYRLPEIISAIFDGFERGYLLGRQYVEQRKEQVPPPRQVSQQGNQPEVGWDFMVDAMDWEAV